MKSHAKGKKQDGVLSFKNVIIGLVAVLIAVYIGGMIYFHARFFPKTQVNGIACGGKSVSALQDEITKEANTYVLRIDGRNGLTDTITADEIALHPVFDDSLEQLLSSQKVIFWPVFVWKLHIFETSTVVSYDEAAFEKKVKSLVFCQSVNQRKPVNAYLSDITENGFEIIPEDVGSTIQKDVFWDVISNAVLTLADIVNLETEGCYLEAAVKSDDEKLVKQRDELNHLVQTRVEYHFGDDVVATTPEIIAEWIVRDDNGKLTLSEEKAREFVNDMARKYDTFGKRRTFETYAGETIDITEGTYGWWMNRPEETKELVARILAGESGVKEPVYFATAAQYGPNDWGDSFVEIDLTAQHLYVHVDGEVVLESDFVSGNVARRFHTPCGIYGITYKERDATLRGQGYNSPVSFWMPFNNNIGMHDASWRKSFGGDIYLTNGSHGCINLPKDMAEQIYELVEKNTPVIVYGGKTLPPKKEEPEVQQPEITEPVAPIPEDVVTPIPENVEQSVPDVLDFSPDNVIM